MHLQTLLTIIQISPLSIHCSKVGTLMHDNGYPKFKHIQLIKHIFMGLMWYVPESFTSYIKCNSDF